MLTLNFDPFPVFESQRFRFRRMLMKDTGEMFRLRSDKTIMQFIDKPLAQSVDEMRDLIKRIDEAVNSNQFISWTVTEKSNDNYIGSISFHRIYPEHFRAEIGYLFAPEYWGRGVASECVAAVSAFGFDKLGFHSIEGKINPAHRASARVLEKNGFVKEAHFKENYFFDGKFLDTVVYSRVKAVAGK